MEIGVQVKELSTGTIGIIEKTGYQSYFVNFGSRKNWKKFNEIELISKLNGTTTTTNIVTKPTPVMVKKTSPPSTLTKPIVSTTKPSTEDPGPRFGNFKFNTTQTLASSPKYSTMPSKAFFDASSATTTTNNNDKPNNNFSLKKPATTTTTNRSPIPDFTQPPIQKPIQPILKTTPQPVSPSPTIPKPATTTNMTTPTNTTTPTNMITPTKITNYNNNTKNNISPPTTNSNNNNGTNAQITSTVIPIITNKLPINNGTAANSPNLLISPREQANKEDMWNISFKELEFEHVIGSGKYGEVSLGKWIGTPVAIKKLLECNEETNPIIERELQILKEIRHPGIVQFLGVTRQQNSDGELEIYIITEFMDGGDLFDSLIFGDQPLSWKEKLRISLDIAQACRYLQARGILHRDLKSQNVLLGSNKRAKLCDLGLARVFDDRINKRLTYVGSDRWMAPEISMGEQYDFKVDVFSFGIVLVEIITNQVPDERYPQKRFEFDNMSFLKKVPRECPPDFASLCCDCTQTDPKKRPDFTKILTTINQIYESLPDDDDNDNE
ncbi:LISK family protein kinase [Tieghemostelium lacteum]|uniref:non-specific serine/threonine protein kinase n=1 Tax=Tieghemostelium lacteum TaxID=361077 RepID=A0A151Z8G9_TIELA|nr:LISK family protein kinase [Tieghemostelium lacteum]|eukprot:KYQ90241.1 LISK family protein kinase [Tieghemostelium lacteum]